MTTSYDKKQEARRKFKAAVYAVSLALATSPPREPRTVGKKFHPRRAACIADREVTRQLARRKFRAAVFAIKALHELQKRRAQVYLHACEEPVFDWEDTTVPVVRACKLTREVSLEVSDLFASEENYQSKVAKLKEGLMYKKKMEEKLLRRWQLQAVALAVTTTKLNRALELNMHPRNKYKGLEYAVALMPAVNIILQSQEEYRRQQLKRKLRRKLKAAVLAIVAIHRLEKVSTEKARKKSKAAAQEWLGRHRHSIVEHRVKDKLAWLGSHIPPRHPRHPHQWRVPTEEDDIALHTGMLKFNWALDEILKTSE